MTEEDAKIKIVIPWLTQRGVRLDELTFETTFRVQVGRRAVELNSARRSSHDSVTGRLDILIARGGRNLVLVEVKHPKEQLTDRDRDQAISYARLVHPIAPFALLTNGTAYRLFDTVTKVEVPQDTPIRDGLSVSLPSAARAEALEIFLGLSQANLLAFCRTQVAEEMRPLMGSASDLSKVYVPELHVERREFHSYADRFLESEAPAFVLLGESGAGKTSSICHLVRELLLRDQPTLFFRGLTIDGRLLDAVADEFEWTFGENQRPFELIKRIDTISQQRPILIVVDAIEEWDYAERVANFASVLRHLRARSCKILLSCKTGSWDAFVHRNGVPTGVTEHIFLPESSTSSRPQSGYVLPPMSDTEFHWAVMNYRQVFDFHGVFEESAINEARRNPYLLRVFFDAARDHRLSNLALTSRELLDCYYNRLLGRTADRESAEATLLAVARVMLRMNQTYIARDVLRGELKLGVNESLMPDLFEQNLLTTKGVGDTHGPLIGFYSEPLRNYLIAYRVLNLPSQDGSELCRLALAAGGVETDAFAYYFPQASVTQQRAVVGPGYDVIEHYLRRYRAIIDAHFAHLRHYFEPRSDESIGMVAELMLPARRIGYFGFRRIRPGDADVLFVPVKGFNPSPDFLFAHGVNQARMNSSIERGTDISEGVFRHEIGPQLRRLIASGELGEANAPELSRELLCGVITASSRIFSDFIDSQTGRPKYPILLAALERAAYRACLYEHFDHIRCDDQRRRGRVAETRNGQFVSYSWRPSTDDRAWVEQRVAETLRNGTAPEHLSASMNSQCLLERVQSAVRNLGGGDKYLEGPGFRVAGGLLLRDACGRPRMDPVALGEAFAEFYKAFLDGYQAVVSDSFPTLKSAFPLFNRLPVRVLVAVSHPHHWDQLAYPLWIATCPRHEGQKTNKVTAIDPAQISYGADRQPIFNGEPLQYFEFTSGTIGSHMRACPPFLPELLPLSDQVLRYKIYSTIQSEIEEVLTTLSQLTETNASSDELT